MTGMRAYALLLVAIMLGGCLDDAQPAPEPSPWHVGEPLPAFDLVDQHNNSWNGSAVNGSGRWVAYFSASWCTHCKPTIDALDRALQANELLIFNKETREGYDNMTQWQIDMEEELSRDLNRSFIHAPELSEAVNVTVIPHVVLVEDGMIIAARIGLWDDVDQISTWFASEAPDSGMTQSMDGM